MSDDMSPKKSEKEEKRTDYVGCVNRTVNKGVGYKLRGGFFYEARGASGRARGHFRRGSGGFSRGRGGQGRGGLEGRRGGFIQDRQRDYEEIKDIVKKLPLFTLDDKLKDGVEEFDGWSLQQLFGFLRGIRKSYKSSKKSTVKSFSVNDPWKGKEDDPTALQQSLWEKFIRLPPPTLKDSLNNSKVYICRSLRLKRLQYEVPEVPKVQYLLTTDILKEEVEPALGECSHIVKIYKKLPMCGRHVILSKHNDLLRKHFISVAEYFFKNPESFPLKRRELY